METAARATFALDFMQLTLLIISLHFNLLIYCKKSVLTSCFRLETDQQLISIWLAIWLSLWYDCGFLEMFYHCLWEVKLVALWQAQSQSPFLFLIYNWNFFSFQSKNKSVDVNTLPVCLKRVRPLHFQSEFESRRYNISPNIFYIFYIVVLPYDLPYTNVYWALDAGGVHKG